MSTLSKVIADNVRGERSRGHRLQIDLARQLGWKQSTVSEVENGRRKVTVDELPELCRALGVPLSDLTRGADPADLQALEGG
jgi:transcriptional regulator with XRE-family HTH domain